MIDHGRSAQEKALRVNLDGTKYGTFAEIGAGQEVARWFFHAGRASATIARTISAYDMAISDSLYGAAKHYVSRERLEAMLDREFGGLVEQLAPLRGERSAFFAFADTMATHGSSRSSSGHGWMGIRFQPEPRTEPSEVIIHIEMSDAYNVSRQETAGLIGVNLIHGAFYSHGNPAELIAGLMDGLDRRRVEIDMIKFSGPAFQGVDNRLMSLQLVEQGHTDAAMFTASGDVVQPSEVLRNRPVVMERGSFRPVTNVVMAILDSALKQFEQGHADEGVPLVLMEMTLKNLMSGTAIDHQDFLARADILAALDKMVMISSYSRFDSVTSYLREYTQSRIGMVVGTPTLRAIFDEQYYTDVEGGILEGLGRLFRGPVTLFVHPTASSGEKAVETADTLSISPKLHHLYAHLFENGYIEPVREFSTSQLEINPGEVLRRIRSGDPSWVDLVPAPAAELIRRNGLFGWNAEQSG